MHELVVFAGFLSTDLLLDVLLAAMSELKSLAHTMQLPLAVVMIASIVVMTQAVLVLG